MSMITFSRPGLVVSIFIPKPPDANAIQLSDSNRNVADPAKLAEAIVSLWSATECAEASPDFETAFKKMNIFKLPEHQIATTEQLRRMLEQTESEESLMSAAHGRSATTHQSILQRQSDALSLRCNLCPENLQDDLSQVASWSGKLIAEAKRRPIFGMTRFYYFEFQETIPWRRQKELNAFASAIQLQLQLPEHRSSMVSLSSGSLLLLRIQSPGNIGTLGGRHNIFVVGIDAKRQSVNEFIANFYRADDYHLVPSVALYALALEKICVHRNKAIQANLLARDNGKSIFAQLNKVANELNDGHETNCQADLAEIAKLLENLDDQLLLVREAQTTINLNMELVADRAAKAFGIDIDREASESLHAFIRDDLTIARQAQLQVSGFADYLKLMTTRFNNRINFIRTQLETLVARRQHAEIQSHERLIERFHLLEVFVVTVYVLELPHIYDNLKERGLVLAATSALIVLCFIFGMPKLRFDHAPSGHIRSRPGWSLRTVFVCALLIVLPFLWASEPFKEAWAIMTKRLTGTTSNTVEPTSEPAHSK
jgi:hypothetical protein